MYLVKVRCRVVLGVHLGQPCCGESRGEEGVPGKAFELIGQRRGISRGRQEACLPLDHQLAGREADFETTMTEWKAASERKESPVSAESMKVLENRQILMAYQKNPVTSLAELIRRLDLKFTDTRPDAAAAENLPTRVDPALISEAAFEKSATDRFPKNTYTQYTGQRRLRELEQVEKFDEEKIRWFLENLANLVVHH